MTIIRCHYLAKNVRRYYLTRMTSLYTGNTYFFKDNSYWKMEKGRLDQEVVTSKSTAIDWMKCLPEEVPTLRPGKGDCICEINRASEISCRSSQWIMLILTMVFVEILLVV